MKKTMLVLCVTLLSVAAVNAQGFRVGVRAGFNASSIRNLPELTADGGGVVADAKNYYLPGFQAGVMAQYMLTSQFGLESGLYYSQLGIKQEANILGLTITAKTNPSYLQLPLTALYKFDAGLGLFLYPQAGVYLGYGIGGKTKMGDLSFDFFTDDVNRFDAGLTFGFNVEHSNFVIGLGYDLGLLKINKESYSGMDDYKHANIKVTLGYFF